MFFFLIKFFVVVKFCICHQYFHRPGPGETALSPKFLGRRIDKTFGEKKTFYMKPAGDVADVPIPTTLEKFEVDRKELPPFMQNIVVMPEKASTSIQIPKDDVKRYIDANGLNNQ